MYALCIYYVWAYDFSLFVFIVIVPILYGKIAIKPITDTPIIGLIGVSVIKITYAIEGF